MVSGLDKVVNFKDFSRRPLKFKTFSRLLRPSSFFSFSVECVSWCWVSRSDWKKKPKKNHKKSRNMRPWYPKMTLKVNNHIFRLTKCTTYYKKCSCFVPVFPYAVAMLIFQIKRIISSEKWFNDVVIYIYIYIYIVFWKCQKFGSVGRR